MAGNCDATNGAGLSNAPTPGWDSSADCSSVMNICSPPTGPSSISPAYGSRCGNVYETRSKQSQKLTMSVRMQAFRVLAARG